MEQVPVAARAGARFPIERIAPAAVTSTILWVAILCLGKEFVHLI